MEHPNGNGRQVLVFKVAHRIDLINHRSMTDEYNQRMARDAAMMVMVAISDG